MLWYILLVTSLISISKSHAGNGGYRDFDHRGSYKRPHSREMIRMGPEAIHEWVTLDYDWPCDWVKDYYTSKGWYEPSVNSLSGIDVYDDDIYVTVLRMSKGVPSGLNKVVVKHGQSLLQPFPSFMFNEIGNCSNLQFPISTATDPNTGLMYVIDVGRVGLAPTDTGCPAKLVVLDLNNNGAVVRSHDFPEEVVSKRTNLLNDLVLDYVTRDRKDIRYAYVTETMNLKIVVFDFVQNKSWAFTDDSMKTDADKIITINNVAYPSDTPVDGIAIDPGFKFVYYCAVGSKKLFQIPTFILRDPNGRFSGNRRFVGNKISNSDGIFYGQKNLYYGALALNAVYRWDISKDIAYATESSVTLVSETEIAQDDERARWVESLKIDTRGYLWFTSSRLHELFAGTLDVSGRSGPNYRINRVYVGEKPYLLKI
ncbi:unnamed protein product [Lymnaea stagnalis]|uniref:Uncharacterized protein n=1 Tax=Lymnaea stagnalis TaxID=6523 RepID=A0AAV2HFX8_LYMST